MKLFGYVKEDKKAKHAALVAECARKLREFGDTAKKKNARDRYYEKSRLAMQIVPNDLMIDEVLDYMMKEKRAHRSEIYPEFWEID